MTSPSDIAILSCNIYPCNFAILQRNISSLIITILHRNIPQSISPLAMALFYGVKSPTAMLPFYDATFSQHLKFSPYHLLPPSPLQPCPNWNRSCRVNASQRQTIHLNSNMGNSIDHSFGAGWGGNGDDGQELSLDVPKTLCCHFVLAEPQDWFIHKTFARTVFIDEF